MELVADCRNYLQACNWVQSTTWVTAVSQQQSQAVTPPSCSTSSCELCSTSPQWPPPCPYQEHPLLLQVAPLQHLYSSVKTSMGLPTNRGSVTWKHLFFHFVQVSQSHLGRICHQVSKRRCPNPKWDFSELKCKQGAYYSSILPKIEVEILLSMLKEQDTSHFCDSHPTAPVDAFQKEKPTYAFCTQNPNEDLKSEAKSLFSIWLLFWGARQEEQMAQHPLAESLTRQSINPPSWTGFLPSGSTPLFWLKHLIKKLQLTENTSRINVNYMLHHFSWTRIRL